MQEEKNEIVQETLDILIYQAIDELNHSDVAVQSAVARVYGFADTLDEDQKLSQEARERMRAYVDEAEELVSIEFRTLYVQGAKDCVTALRKLGVIK